MTDFPKYQHLERHGREIVGSIDIGKVYVFPKMDGTNARIGFSSSSPRHCEIIAGSRHRILSLEGDNAGFAHWCSEEIHRNALVYFATEVAQRVNVTLEDIVIYGEWLVPHTFKQYHDSAWRRFWIFDVFDKVSGKYIPYEEYSDVDGAGEVDIVPPLCVITNPSIDQLAKCLNETNTFMVKEGAGVGEGIVLKNYGWVNTWGKQVWAKMIHHEFKHNHLRVQGPPELVGDPQVEWKIAESCVTGALCKKELAKLEQSLCELDGTPAARGKLIPAILSSVYHCIVTEELWDQLKKFKNPVIDFKKLQRYCIAQTKAMLPELF